MSEVRYRGTATDMESLPYPESGLGCRVCGSPDHVVHLDAPEFDMTPGAHPAAVAILTAYWVAAMVAIVAGCVVGAVRAS